MIYSFRCEGNSSLLQIELTRLWISERIVLRRILISSAGILSIAGDLFLLNFEQSCQPQRHWAEAVKAQLRVLRSGKHH